MSDGSGSIARGRLITIEGIDGAGKTTVAERLAAEIETLQVLREPGGVALAERIRALVKTPAVELHPRAEALLYAAARAQLVAERLAPLLAAGRDVLLDRFVDSSLAYQGAGRGLGIRAIADLNEFATDAIAPDRTLLLRLDPQTASARAAGRGAPADRLERAGSEFFATVAAAYDELAAAAPDRFVVIDAARSPAAVYADCLAAVRAALT